MDFQGSPEDSTKVVRMMDELNSFVKGGRRRPPQQGIPIRLESGRKSRSASRLLGTLDFDMSSIEENEGEGSKDENKNALHEQKVELLAAKSKIIRLETELNAIESDKKRMRLDYDRENTDFKLQIQRDQTDRDEVMQRLRRAMQKEETLQQEIEEHEREINDLKEKMKNSEHEHRKEKEKIKKVLEESKRKEEAEILDMKERLDRKCMEVMSCKLKLEEALARENLLKRKVSSMVPEGELHGVKLDLEKALHKAKELEEKLVRTDEGNSMAKKLQSDLSRLKEVERLNAKLTQEVKLLKEGSENYILLQEKYESSMGKLKRAEARIVDLQKLEVENEALKKKIERWQYEDGNGTIVARSPEALIKEISALQKSQISLKEEIGALTASKGIHENALQRLVEKYRVLKDDFNKTKNKEAANEVELKRVKRKLFLAIAERDGIRNVLDQEIADQNSSQLRERLKEMDEKTMLFNKEIENLEKDVVQLRKDVDQYRVKSQKLETELETAQIQLSVKTNDQVGNGAADQDTRIKGLQKGNEMLEKKVLLLEAELETKGLKGCFDPSKTKILHMAFNPYSKMRQSREEEYKELKAENERLKAALASTQTVSKGMDPATSTLSLSSTEKELTAKLESAELKYKRLHEVFEDRVKQFREACYQLFGYRIDVKGTSKYQLFPMYADSRDDFFIFQYDGNDLQMVETEFSKTCQDAVEMFLFRGNSIPAFLSAVTTKLFANETAIRDTTFAKTVSM